MRKLHLIAGAMAAVVILVSSGAAAAPTAQDRLLRRVDKVISSREKPGKTLCACMSDGYPTAPKRVGVLTGGILQAGSVYVAVTCSLPAYDPNGDLLPGMPESCGTWVPIGR